VLGFRFEVRSVRPLAPFSIDALLAGLPKPLALAWLPPAVDSRDVMSTVASQAPEDGVEIVSWMHLSAADMAVFDVFAQSVERSGGSVSYTSNDAFIPGVRLASNYYVVSEGGWAVSSRGYARVATPYGTVNAPVPGKQSIVFRDFLGWFAAPWAGSYQWTATLLRWDRLPVAPVREKISFPSSHGYVAPVYVVAGTRAPVPVMTLRIVLSSDRSQTVVLRGRSPSDYTQALFEEKVDIGSGQNEIVVNVFGLPVAPRIVLEIQPADNTRTTLDALEVFPP